MRIHLHLFDPAQVPLHPDVLTEAERHRASSFRFEKDSSHWAACRTGLRIILGRALSLPPREVSIGISAGGKPVLAAPFDGTHFNLSHCRDFAVVAIAASPVGVDIEPAARAPDLLGCEESFCHPSEIASLPTDPVTRAISLLEIWTAKEALLKAHGTGFMTPPQEVAMDLAEAPARVLFTGGLTPFHTHRLRHPALEGHIAFVSSREPEPEVIYHSEFRAVP